MCNNNKYDNQMILNKVQSVAFQLIQSDDQIFNTFVNSKNNH